MTETPIKFNSVKEAFCYFRDLGFLPWDAHKLAFSLYRNEWGADRVQEKIDAERNLRHFFPGLADAAARYNASERAVINQEHDLTGTDLDIDEDPGIKTQRAIGEFIEEIKSS